MFENLGLTDAILGSALYVLGIFSIFNQQYIKMKLNKKTAMIVAASVLATIVLRDQLAKIPYVDRIPAV